MSEKDENQGRPTIRAPLTKFETEGGRCIWEAEEPRPPDDGPDAPVYMPSLLLMEINGRIEFTALPDSDSGFMVTVRVSREQLRELGHVIDRYLAGGFDDPFRRP
jgi:hypothetical protein